MVGLTADFRPAPESEGPTSWGDIGLDELAAAGLDWKFLENDGGPLRAEDLAGLSAVIVGSPAVTAETLAGVSEVPLNIVARFGVGYDSVDLEACSAAGVAVTITPDGARRPVATSILTMVLALQHHLVVKDSLVRSGDWGAKTAWHGVGLSGSTVGFVGMGNIGAETVALMKPFGVKVLAYDPYLPPERATEVGAELVDLQTVLEQADVVILTAALTAENHHVIGVEALAAMKPSALLVNLARGGLVDTEALVAALESGSIRGAGLDVFETEPLPADHPLISMDRVILAPHALSWTSEMAYGNGRSAIRAVIAALSDGIPEFVVNRSVLEHPQWANAERSSKVAQ